MARRSDHSREQLYALVIAAAQKCAEADGLRGITARRIAAEIGYSPGTLYNVFADRDDIVTRVNIATLEALYRALAETPLQGDPVRAIRALARRYIAFIREHPKLWNLLFEHHLPPGRVTPERYYDQVERLLGLVESALTPLFGPRRQRARRRAARVLWSAVHGICSLEGAGKLIKGETVEGLADSLVTHYLAGLEQTQRRTRGQGRASTPARRSS